MQAVLKRIRHDIAWLEKRLTTPPKESGDNCDGGDAADFTQYFFNGKGPYDKERLVLAVIRHWVREKRTANVNALSMEFPQKLTGAGGSSGLLMSLQKAQMLFQQTGYPQRIMTRGRFDTIVTGDGREYTVSSQWTNLNIRYFIDNARRLGYEIKQFAGDD
ncbi:MAG: hypothetical protein ACR2P4_01405 [Gammaproteobacteria bacterium]